VSHDPYVIEMIADRLWLVEDGSIIQFDGDLNDYRSKVLRPSKTARDVGGQHGKKNQTRKSKRQEDAIKRQQLSPLYKKLRDTEKTITNLSSKKRELSERLSDPELYAGDPLLIVSLQREHGETIAALEREEAIWIEISERIEEGQCV
jgi:ATP-binding cassette subfamily F protein 3